jgi:hypothetical protein
VRTILLFSGITLIMLLLMAERLWRHRQQEGHLGRALALRDGVHVWTKTGCPACDRMKRVHAGLIEAGLMIVHDAEHSEAAATVLGLRAVPTTIVVRSGLIVDSILGFASAERLARWISSTSAGGSV